jgi:Endonuclease/Exonuclease/phosphatase family
VIAQLPMPYVTRLKFATIRVLAAALSVFVNFIPLDFTSIAISLPQPWESSKLLELPLGLNSFHTLSDPAGLDEPSQTARLTVTSYNIHSCMGLDLRIRCDRIAAILSRTHADVIGLQEVRAGQEEQIAHVLGFHVVFAKADHVGGYEFGNAILSRFPVRRSDVYPIGVPHHEQRVCLHAEIAWPGDAGTIHVFSVHLGQNERKGGNKLNALRRMPFSKILHSTVRRAYSWEISTRNREMVSLTRHLPSSNAPPENRGLHFSLSCFSIACTSAVI